MATSDEGFPDLSVPMNKGKVRLSSLTPEQREVVASWLEDKVKKLPAAIHQANEYLRTNPNDVTTQRQVQWYRSLIGAAKWFAYMARTERTRQQRKE